MTVIKRGKLSYIGIMNDKATKKSPKANTNVSLSVVEPSWSAVDNFNISGMPIPEQGFHIGDTITMVLSHTVKSSSEANENTGGWHMNVIPMRVMELAAHSDTDDDEDGDSWDYTIDSAAVTLRSVELYNGFYIEINTIISDLTENEVKVNDVLWFSIKSE